MQDRASSAAWLRVGIVGASGYTGAELLRLARRPPRPRRACVATGDTQAGTAGRRPLPEPRRRPTPTCCSRRSTPRRAQASTWCSWACRTARARRSCPSSSARSATSSTWPPTSGCTDPSLYPQWYGEAHTAPELLPDFAYGLPELFRDDDRGVRPRRGARAAIRRPRGWRWRRWCGPGRSWPTGSSSTRRRACRAPVDRRSRTPPSARSTRTSPPTGCSTTATRPRSSRSRGASVLFTPHLAPMNRGILATCYARPTGADLHRRAARPPAGRLRRRAVRGRERRVAVDQGHPRLERAPTSRPGSTSAPAGSWPRGASTTSPRAPRARRCSAPTCSSASPRPPASPSSGCTRDDRVNRVTPLTRRGLHVRRTTAVRPSRRSRRRGTPTSAWWPRPTARRWRRPACSPRTR